MTRVLVDDALLSQLHNLSEPLELVDKSGRVVGHIEPVESMPYVVDMSDKKRTGPTQEP